MSTTPLFELAKVRVAELNTWAAADCPGATYEDLLRIDGDVTGVRHFNQALEHIRETVALLTAGRPIKISLDNAGFSGDRLPVYHAAFGTTAKAKRIHDLMETN